MKSSGCTLADLALPLAAHVSALSSRVPQSQDVFFFVIVFYFFVFFMHRIIVLRDSTL